MRRLLLVLAALALLAPSAAAAGKPTARLVITKGAVRNVGANVTGWFVVANRGRAVSPPVQASVVVRGAPGGPGGVLKVLVKGTLATPSLTPLGPERERRVRFIGTIPKRIVHGVWSVSACVEVGGCRRIGSHALERRPTSSGPSSHEAGTPASQPLSTVPTDPLLYIAGEPFEVSNGPVPYWAFVPKSYDRSNLTPAPLLVWLHGCGGESSGDIWVVDPGAEEEPQDWVTIAVGDREGECWTPRVDEAKVMGALADAETHFNIDRGRVALGGYSSGGDLAYRTGFRHSETFAGLLIENSSPFRDTESS
ncbi:MAG TPA: hypothetical protein VHZ54_17390, partial [Solirubrobacterales bacterium]|nr:hypothetical protein [Solirubrobacterales bacterium]